ncbi:asparaginase domain-containing protein [Spirochaeta dissipatitropha]
MKESAEIRLIITGGTFDKHYDELKGELTFKDSHLPDIISHMRIHDAVNFQLLQLIDSLSMTDSHREDILTACRNAVENRIIITHGTDRMPETARYLGMHHIPKVIVLTGAMVPYKFTGTDALFNLGSAFAAVNCLPPGVYIAMNGRTFTWESVYKDLNAGMFRSET